MPFFLSAAGFGDFDEFNNIVRHVFKERMSVIHICSQKRPVAKRFTLLNSATNLTDRLKIKRPFAKANKNLKITPIMILHSDR